MLPDSLRATAQEVDPNLRSMVVLPSDSITDDCPTTIKPMTDSAYELLWLAEEFTNIGA